MQDDEQDSARESDTLISGPEPQLPSHRFCGECGAQAAAADEIFCTSCGNTLPTYHGGATATDTGVLPAVAPTAMPLTSTGATAQTFVDRRPPLNPDQISATSTRTRLSAAVVVLTILVLAATVTFAVLWRSQASHAQMLHGRLDKATGQLVATRSTLASTEAKLAATTALSARRRAVLLQAQAVLKKVDPLLSSVDGVQQQAGNIRSGGSALSADAETLIGTIVTLVNYLVDWGSNADTAYVNELIDEANGELDTVRADELQFATDTGSYDKAGAAFGNKADAFSTAVRSLQTQLKRGTAGR